MIGRRRTLDFGGLLHGLFSYGGLGLGLVSSGGGVAPAGKDQPPFGNANVGGKLAIALGRPRLSPERAGPLLHVGEDFVQPVEVGLRCAQLLFRILAADVQAGNASCLFQHRAPVDRLGGDDSTDLALADKRGGMRAGGGIRKE